MNGSDQDESSEIKTARLRLRAFVAEDLDDLCQIYGDPEVAVYFISGGAKSREQSEAMLTRDIESFEKRGIGVWGLIYKPENKLIGRAALQYLDQTSDIEISYILAKSHWGMGLATEAAKAMLKHGFEKAGLDRIVGVAHVDHGASHRVMEKAGMRYERNAEYYNNPMKCYEITRENYQPDEAIHIDGRA